MRERAMMFLQGMANDPGYTMATQQIMHDIQQIPEQTPLPPKYCNPTLPLTLLAHPSAIHAMRKTSATINVTQATHQGGHSTSNNNSRRGFDRDRSHSRERRQTSTDPTNKRSSSITRSSQSTPRPQQSRNIELQCRACATNGHKHADCRIFPKIAACLDYITKNPSESKDALYQYRKMQHPDNRRAAREKGIKVLQGRITQGQLGHDEDLEDLADQLTGDYWPDTDEQSASICQLQLSHLDQEQTLIVSASSTYSSNDLKAAAHPVEFPDGRMMNVSRMETCWSHFPSPSTTPTVQTNLCITQGTSRLDNRRDLADTGASVCATGMRGILHDFTPHTSYAIVGYDGAATHAAGQGTAHIIHPTTGSIEKMFFVYVPSIRGTIVSLEHHA